MINKTNQRKTILEQLGLIKNEYGVKTILELDKNHRPEYVTEGQLGNYSIGQEFDMFDMYEGLIVYALDQRIKPEQNRMNQLVEGLDLLLDETEKLEFLSEEKVTKFQSIISAYTTETRVYPYASLNGVRQNLNRAQTLIDRFKKNIPVQMPSLAYKNMAKIV